jgi:hypothetical protein
MTTFFKIIENSNKSVTNKLSNELEAIKTLYLTENKSLKEIANIYNADVGTITRLLNANNIAIKNRGNAGSKIITINAFLPYTEHSYYWIGYLAADGFITKDETRNTVGVSSKDIEHMLKYRDFIHPDIKEIDTINKAGSLIRTITFGHKETKDFLVSIGITPNKTHTLKLNIPFNNHILRGLFDGDGHVSKNTGFKITTASINLIEQLEDYVKKDLPFIRLVVTKKSETTFDVYFRKGLKELYHYLYDDATIYLERKKQVMSEAFSSDTN